MELNVTLYDSEGNITELSKCKCGKIGETCIMSKNYIQWMCNDCLYPVNPEENKLVYVEYGGGWPEGFQERMDERSEKARNLSTGLKND